MWGGWYSSWGGGGWLVKNLRLLEADFEAKQLRGICKARCETSKGPLSVGDKDSFIRKEKVLDQPLLHLGVGLEASKIEETAIQTVHDAHPVIIIQVCNCLLEHHAEEHAEESRCQDTTLFHAVRGGKGSDRSPLSLICPRWFSCS